MQVLEIQRGQSAGSVFGDVAWNVARRGLTNTVAPTPRGRAPRNSCRRADLRLTRPGSSQRAKGECSSPRLREAWLLLRGMNNSLRRSAQEPIKKSPRKHKLLLAKHELYINILIVLIDLDDLPLSKFLMINNITSRDFL